MLERRTAPITCSLWSSNMTMASPLPMTPYTSGSTTPTAAAFTFARLQCAVQECEPHLADGADRPPRCPPDQLSSSTGSWQPLTNALTIIWMHSATDSKIWLFSTVDRPMRLCVHIVIAGVTLVYTARGQSGLVHLPTDDHVKLLGSPLASATPARSVSCTTTVLTAGYAWVLFPLLYATLPCWSLVTMVGTLLAYVLTPSTCSHTMRVASSVAIRICREP